MLKNLLAISVLGLTLGLSGCGDNSESTCRVGVQIAIDKGNYDQAINDLNGVCKNAFSSSDLNYNLATAYMGKAGFSISDLIKTIINSNNTSGSGNNNTFSTFMTSVNTDKKNNSAVLLNDAQTYYIDSVKSGTKNTIGTLCSRAELNASKSTRLSSACLYLGFNQTLQTANTITLLTGNVDALVTSIDANSSATPVDMQASLDALSWAIDVNNTFANGSTITATDVNISGNTLVSLKVVDTNASGLTFYRLAKSNTRDTNNSTVLTDGYCDVNGSKSNCNGIENSDGSIDTTLANAASCYACPVDFGNNTTGSIADLLVNTLNSGVGTVGNVSDDPDILASINNFKTDLNVSADANVTIQDLVNYLNK